MADTVSKQSSEPFTTQARQHGTVAENVRQMVGQGDMCHGTLEESMAGSCMSEVTPLYTEWWQSFKQHLSNHANQHDNLASNLNQAASNFDATDTQTEQFVNDASGDVGNRSSTPIANIQAPTLGNTPTGSGVNSGSSNGTPATNIQAPTPGNTPAGSTIGSTGSGTPASGIQTPNLGNVPTGSSTSSGSSNGTPATNIQAPTPGNTSTGSHVGGSGSTMPATNLHTPSELTQPGSPAGHNLLPGGTHIGNIATPGGTNILGNVAALGGVGALGGGIALGGAVALGGAGQGHGGQGNIGQGNIGRGHGGPANQDERQQQNQNTANRVEDVPLTKIRYSQETVSPRTRDGRTINEVANNMRENGWDRTQAPPDMVDWSDGEFQTLDHRRILAAKQADLTDIPANIHPTNEPLPPEQQARFRFRVSFTDPDTGRTYRAGTLPRTWGEAAMGRSAKQGPSFPLKGSPTPPRISGSPNQ